MAEIIAGTAVLGGAGAAVGWVTNLWSYNRENWSFDRGQEQNALHQQQGMRISRYTQYREDMRDLFGLTVEKTGSYLTVATLQLGFVISLYYDGRLPQANVSTFDPSPYWLCTTYGLSLGTAGLFLTLSIYFSITASIQAQSFCVRVLTQYLRLPVPTDEDVWACASRYKEYESSGTQMRVPFVSTAGRKMFNTLKKTIRGDNADDEAEDYVQSPRNPGQGGDRLTDGEYNDRMRSVKNERGERQNILTHRYMGVGGYLKGGKAALGPPLLVVEDSCGQAVPVKSLPHIKLFRTLQGHWLPYDAYARVCMVLGTISILLALSHFSAVWYLRALNQVVMSLVFTTSWCVASILLLFLEINFHTIAEKIMVVFIMCGAHFFPWLGAMTDHVVLQRMFNEQEVGKGLWWNLRTGKKLQEAFGISGHACMVAWICIYYLVSRPMNIKGFVKYLPHRFRNVRVIDVFAPLNNQLKKEVSKKLKREDPATKKQIDFKTENHTFDFNDSNRASDRYQERITRCIDLREHIGITLARLFQNPSLQNHRPMAQLAVNFQKECMRLQDLIPSTFVPRRTSQVTTQSTMNLFANNNLDDNISSKNFSGHAIDNIFDALDRQVQMFSQMIGQLETTMLEERMENRRLEQMEIIQGEPAKLEREPISRLPFGLLGQKDANKALGMDTGMTIKEKRKGDQSGEEQDQKVIELNEKAPWDPPRAHLMFQWAAFLCIIWNAASLIWSFTSLGIGGFSPEPSLPFNYQQTGLEDEREKVWLEVQEEYRKMYEFESDSAKEAKSQNKKGVPERRRRLNAPRIRSLLADYDVWKKNPTFNSHTLTSCSEDRVTFCSDVDCTSYNREQFGGSSSSTAAPVLDPERITYEPAPYCGVNAYDAVAIDESSKIISVITFNGKENEITQCHLDEEDEGIRTTVMRLPKNEKSRIIAMSLLTPRSFIVALADGRITIIEKNKSDTWIANRILGNLQSVQSLTVEPEFYEDNFRRMFLIANQTTFSATLLYRNATEITSLTTPIVDKRFHFPVQTVKFCNGGSEKVVTTEEDEHGRELQMLTTFNTRVAVQLPGYWWIINE